MRRTDMVARRGADAALAIGVATAIAAVVAHALDRNVPLDSVLPENARVLWLVNAALAVSWGVPGWYLVRHRAGVAFGWVALSPAVGLRLSPPGPQRAVARVVPAHPPAGPTRGTRR